MLTALSLGLGLSACEEHTVAIRFDPQVGDVYRYRAEIDTAATRVIEDEVTRDAERAVLDATQTVRSVGDDEILVSVAVRRDDSAPRTFDIRLDRASRLTAIDLIEGVPAEALGLDVTTALPADITSPPAGRLEPGARWQIAREIQIGDLGRPVLVRGSGRIDSLGVEDGREVAVAIVELDVPVRSQVDSTDGTVRLIGTQHTVSETAYDLADGAVRRDRTDITGDLDVIVEPPPGVDASPLRGEIDYQITTRTERLATPT